MSWSGAASRLVSLIPAATEIVCALGLGDRLVGRSHECDHPPEVSRLPAITAPTFDPAAPSAGIERSVRELLAQALSVYRVDAEALRALRPDVVVTQTQCEVCAVGRDQVAALGRWTGTGARILSLEATSLSGVWTDVRRTAAALGVAERGERLAARLAGRMAEIEARAARIESRPEVVTIEWIDPLMAGGNWMPELIAMAGGRELLGAAGKPSHWISFEDLAAADPEVILVQPCGFGLDRTLDELGSLRAHPAWPALRAVEAGRVYLSDGHQFFHRPGPRLVESLEILAEILHPAHFRFGHEGSGWVRLHA